MRNKFFFPLMIVAAFCSSVNAQNDYSVSQFFKETGRFFTQPLRWDGEDWYKFGFTTAATGIAMAIEPRPSDVPFLQAQFYNSPPVTAGRIYGEPYTAAALIVGYAGYSIITGNRTTTKIAYELFQTCAYSAALVYTIKFSVGRARPYTFEGKSSFHPFASLTNDSVHSFPSGHTTIAFALSTVLSMNADALWLKILAYVPAVFTPFSRAYQGFHWISDCAFGAGIGYFIGKWVVDNHDRADQASQDKSAIQVTSIYPFTVSVALK